MLEALQKKPLRFLRLCVRAHPIREEEMSPPSFVFSRKFVIFVAMKLFRPLSPRRYLAAAIVTLMSVVLAACTISYKLNGAAIDYNVYKTIHVSQFPIRAALVYPPLQQTFENDLLDYITRNTRLRTVDTSSDLHHEGENTGYALSPQAVT